MARPKEREFLKQVKAHEMTVIRDDDIHRHLRFKKPSTSDQYFDIITWPGSLCFSGDMGTFVFSRIEDMFEFFRAHPDPNPKRRGLQINPQYWSEKLDAADRRTGGFEKFSPELFRKNILLYAKDCDASRAAIEAINDQVFGAAEDGEYQAYQAAYQFRHEDFDLTDFCEVNCREYTYHFVWCCYALVWSIKKYDKFKAKQTKD